MTANTTSNVGIPSMKTTDPALVGVLSFKYMESIVSEASELNCKKTTLF
jgi:hypothetical protein